MCYKIYLFGVCFILLLLLFISTSSHEPPYKSYSLPDNVCSCVALRIVSGMGRGGGRFLLGHSMEETCPSIRFSRGMCYVPFSLALTPPNDDSALFSLSLFHRQWFAAIKPHRQATHVYRVSKGTRLFYRHGPSDPPRPPSEAGPLGGAYDIFVIMLPDTCPSVTTAPRNKQPWTTSSFFPFMAAYARSSATLHQEKRHQRFSRARTVCHLLNYRICESYTL